MMTLVPTTPMLPLPLESEVDRHRPQPAAITAARPVPLEVLHHHQPHHLLTHLTLIRQKPRKAIGPGRKYAKAVSHCITNKLSYIFLETGSHPYFSLWEDGSGILMLMLRE